MRLSDAIIEIKFSIFCLTCYTTIIIKNHGSFEINKIIAAVLVVFLVVFGIGKISDIIFHVEKPNTSAYKVEISTATSSQVSSAVKMLI